MRRLAEVLCFFWTLTGWAKTQFPFEEYFRDPTSQWSVIPRVSPDGQWMVYGVHVRPERSIEQARYQPSGLASSDLGVRLEIISPGTKQVVSVCGSERENCTRPSWSPTSDKLAYYSDKTGKLQLWVYDLKSKRSRALSKQKSKMSLWPGDEPLWSKDGKEVYAPVGIEEGANASPRLITTVSDVDSDLPIVLHSALEKTEDSAEAQRQAPINAFLRSEQLAGLVALNLKTGKTRAVVSPESALPPARFRISSSGEWLSYLSVLRNTSSTKQEAVMDLVVVSKDGKRVLPVATNLARPNWEYFDHSYRWHPTEDFVVFLKDGTLWKFDPRNPEPKAIRLGGDLSNLTHKPLIYNEDGSAIFVGGEPHNSIGLNDSVASVLYRVPLSGDAKTVTLKFSETERLRNVLPSTDKQVWASSLFEMAAIVGDTKEQTVSVIAFERETFKQKKIFSGPFRLTQPALRSNPGGGLIIQYEDVETPLNYFSFDSTFSKKERLTNISPNYEKQKVALEPPKVLQTLVPVGETKKKARAIVLTPKGAKDKKWPAVIMGYPGSDETTQAVFFGGGDVIGGTPALFYLAQGYAVVIVDLPMLPKGSPSNPVRDLTAVLEPQIDSVIANTNIDPQRIAFIGQSYGGYMAASVITQTKRLRAAIAVSGIFDLPMFYARLDLRNGGNSLSTQWAEGGQGGMGGSLWAELPRYLENSPFFQADKIETPLLMVHGTDDMGFDQAKGMVVALRRLGKRGTLAAYPNEDHSIHQWSVGHAVHANQQIFQFLDRELACTSCSQ